MRTADELLRLIMSKAEDDDRIRAVTLNGSRASKSALIDKYSDFDITYFVSDVREFTKEKDWISYFGDILIVQYSMDWYSSPYDYSSRDTFVYLIQFEDGNRIDLSIVDISNIKKEEENKEPKVVLLNKDNFKELESSNDETEYFIKEPTDMEYYNTCNEFRWLSIYITKGLCRSEIYYAKYAYDVLIMEMFMKMLNWKIGIENQFKVTTGTHKKYLKRFLSKDELNRVHSIFPDGSYEDIWEKLFMMYDYFHELECIVGYTYGFKNDTDESYRVKKYIQNQKKETK
ncbi:MAG: aminoglycoside 6-adenylyltransferase [Clostridiales bacterium]|nr:aminoglycoside 6-adenylyltransferase [Clostridiales bacterium]